MKKALLSLGLLTGIVGAAQAQETRFGLKAGVNLANVAGKDVEKSFQNRIGANAGLMADVSFSDLISFHPELLYSEKGAKISDSNSGSFNGAQTTYSETGKVRLSYLDLPLLLRVKTNGLFFEAGPQVGYLMSLKSESTYTFTSTVPGGSTITDTESSSSTETKGTRRLDFGYVAGVGYQLPQGLEIGVRYNGGISSLDDSSSNQIKAHNSVFQFQVGYLFGGK